MDECRIGGSCSSRPELEKEEEFPKTFHPVMSRIYPYNNKQYERRNGKRKNVFRIGFWFFLGVSISLVGILICGYSFNLNGKDGREEGKCLTPICMEAASRFLQRFNPKVNPCSDFYSFSCGNFLARNEIPDDSFQRSTLQEMQESILIDIKKLIEARGVGDDNMGIKKARELYDSCMDGSFRTSHYSDYSLLPIYSVLRGDWVGEWPILQGSFWNSSHYSVESILAQLFTHQVQNIFELYVIPDEEFPSKYLLQFYKGEPAMAKAFFLNSTNTDYIKYVRSYKRLLLESVLILSHGKQGSLPSLYADVDSILDFETKFAKLVQKSRCQFDGFDMEEGEDDYGRVTLEEIENRIPQIKWMTLVQNLFDNLGLGRNVSGDMIVYFHCSEFFPGLVNLIEETDKRTVTNYLIWRFVFRYMPFLGNKFLQIWMEFMKDVPDTNEERLYLSRWKQCSSIINDGFGMAMSYLYVKQSYKPGTEKIVKEMITYLKKAFGQVVGEQPWIMEYFKAEIIDKLNNMGNKIGYPPYIMDKEALEKEYEGLEFNEQYFLMNILKLRKFEVTKEIRKVSRPVDKEKDWLIQPLVANAFHNPTSNEIVIPLGILRFPIFHTEYPMYLNFANLGIVIAHEMTHGFDHQGMRGINWRLRKKLKSRHYDMYGNLSNWWPEEVMASFKEQALCFVNQYEKFNIPIVNTHVDGNETLADNICDNAALRHAWLAYRMWAADHSEEAGLPGVNMTIPEIFYVTYGQIWCEVLNKEGYEQYVRDPHSPGQFRTWGVAQNNRDFATIFNCPMGSPMNKPGKCMLWS